MPADPARTFYDTNVLVYLLLDDVEKSRSLDPHLAAGGLISVQVLNEITNVGRRKHRMPMERIRLFLTKLQNAVQVVSVSSAIHERGLDLIERHNFSTYDAMIVAAALKSNCSLLLSEDMQHGMSVEGKLRIENPFLG